MRFLTDLVRGAGYVVEGMRLVRRPGIRRHALAPFVVDAVIFTAVFGAGLVWLPDWVSGRIEALAPNWDWIEWILWPLLALLALGVAAITSLLLAGILAIPFSPALAAAVLEHIEGRPPAGGGGGIVETLRNEAGKLVHALRLALPLALLSLIPVVQIVAAPLWLLFGAWSLTLEFTDYAFEHKGLAPRQGRERLRERRGLALGFGGLLLCLSLIPVANLVTIPIAVAGATALVSRERLAGDAGRERPAPADRP